MQSRADNPGGPMSRRWCTLVPRGAAEFREVWQQFSLQTYRRQTEVPEQRLSSQTVLLMLIQPKTNINFINITTMTQLYLLHTAQ